MITGHRLLASAQLCRVLDDKLEGIENTWTKYEEAS